MSEKSSVLKMRSAAREAAGVRLSKRRTELRRVLSHDLTDRRTRTRTKLLTAGRELIVEQGIGAMSVGDVCSRAGFTRGAFYSNFSDMEHFVQELAEGLWGELEAILRQAIEDVHQPPHNEELTTLIQALRTAIPMSRDFYFLHNELVMHTIRGEHSEALRASYHGFRNSMIELVRVGYARIGRVCLLPMEDMTDLLFSLTERSMRRALLEGDASSGSLSELFDDALPEVLMRLSTPIQEPPTLDQHVKLP